MASNNVEIEIKFPVSRALFQKVKKFLKAHAVFGGASKEKDSYFNHPHRDFLAGGHPTEYLRVRQRGGAGSFTYKNVYLNKFGSRTHSDEFESKVEEPGQVIKILKVLNFKKFLVVKKKRETYIFEGKYEIALDDVKDLGYFIEALDNAGGVQKTRRRIFEFSKELGIQKLRKTNGYVIDLMRKKGLIGEM